METNYWKKDQFRQDIITKSLIPNERNFEFFANYFNLMDAKGLSFHLSENIKVESEKLFSKNGFEFFFLQHNNLKELLILPNENLEKLTMKIVSKINYCEKESDVLELFLREMN